MHADPQAELCECINRQLERWEFQAIQILEDERADVRDALGLAADPVRPLTLQTETHVLPGEVHSTSMYHHNALNAVLLKSFTHTLIAVANVSLAVRGHDIAQILPALIAATLNVAVSLRPSWGHWKVQWVLS